MLSRLRLTFCCDVSPVLHELGEGTGPAVAPSKCAASCLHVPQASRCTRPTAAPPPLPLLLAARRRRTPRPRRLGRSSSGGARGQRRSCWRSTWCGAAEALHAAAAVPCRLPARSSCASVACLPASARAFRHACTTRAPPPPPAGWYLAGQQQPRAALFGGCHPGSAGARHNRLPGHRQGAGLDELGGGCAQGRPVGRWVHVWVGGSSAAAARSGRPSVPPPMGASLLQPPACCASRSPSPAQARPAAIRAMQAVGLAGEGMVVSQTGPGIFLQGKHWREGGREAGREGAS